MRLRAKNTRRKKWQEWFAELQRLGIEKQWPVRDWYDWRDFWLDGYTPKDALAEDMSNADWDL